MLSFTKSRSRKVGTSYAGKTKNLYWLFFILFLTAEIYPQSGWFYQSPIPTVETLSDVYFTDTFNGTAVAGNKIIRTTDGGTNWIIQYDGIETYYNFQAVYLTDANNGWVVDYLGKILKTTDGGDNWVKINYESKYLSDVHFIDSNTGFVVGGNGILKTTDAGNTWSSKLTDSHYTIHGVTFTDESNGTAVGGYYWGSNSSNKFLEQQTGATSGLLNYL